MRINCKTLQAPWIGKTPEEYYGCDEDEENEFDEDFAYESWRDMQMEREEYERRNE